MKFSKLKFLYWFKKKKVKFGDLILPAKHLRLCGDDFKDDEYFIASAVTEVERLEKNLGLNKSSRILDVGCGYGRLPLGIINYLGTIRLYQGIDVDPISIKWCKKYLEKNYDNFFFLRIDVKNIRYNPKGNQLSTEFIFPFKKNSFDIIYLFSVFSHMVADDIRVYLKAFRKILIDEGKIFLTAFTENDVPTETINPQNYGIYKWKGPLHCVRFNKEYFDSILIENGFRINQFDYAKEKHGQSGYYLSLK